MRSLKNWILIYSCFVSIGCGSKQVSPSVSLKAVSDFETAQSMVIAKDYHSALTLFETLEKTGALSRNDIVRMYLMKGQCYAALGQDDEAIASLQMAEQGAEEKKDIVDLNLELYKYWKKKGDFKKSELALQTAQEYDPSVNIPK